MGEPIRIQRRRTKGWGMPPNTVSVTRPGPWGNYAGDTREDFERWLDEECTPSGRAFYVAQVRAQLRGKNLACFCGPDQPCHADVLLGLARG